MQKQSIQDILLRVSQIDSKLDSVTQDKCRLICIEELKMSGGIEYVGKIVQDLYFEPSKKKAYSIISGKNNGTLIDDNSYLRVAEKQNHQQAILSKLKRDKSTSNNQIFEEIDDTESYQDALDYFMKNTDSASEKRNYHIKELKKLKTEYQRFNYLKGIRLWLDNSGKNKAYNNHKDDYYENKAEGNNVVSKKAKKPIIIGTVNPENKKRQKDQRDKENERRMEKSLEKQSMKSKKSKPSKTKKYRNPKNFLAIFGNSILEEIVLKWYNQGKNLQISEKSICKIESFMFFWISFNAMYYATTQAGTDERSWKEFTEKEEVKSVWNNIMISSVFIVFLEYLKIRKVYDKFDNHIQTGGIHNMKDNISLTDWDFGTDLQKYIRVIYQIRNNLFHGGKRGDDSDIELIEKASKSFLVFLEKLYGFDDN